LNTGEVTSIVGDQVVVKSSSPPPAIGAAVFGDKGRVGVVADVIGPVERPYYVVKADPKITLKIADRLRSK
jgi:rRNA processing protein Gar1